MLKAKVIQGISWTAFSNVFRQIIQIISLIIYTRYLTPSDFGNFALIMVVVAFSQLFNNMGTSSAIIYKNNHSTSFVSSIFYLNIFIGLFIFGFIVFISPYIALFYNNSNLENLLNLIALIFIISSFSTVQKALLEKELEFKSISIIETLSIVIAIGIGIYSAINNFGVYSLIIQSLVNAILTVVLLWYFSKWRPSLMFSFDDIKEIFSFIKNLTLFNIINFAGKNLDQILIGKFLSSGALGLYSLAFKIIIYPIQNITAVISKVMFPAFSKIQDDNEKIKHIYLKMIFFISLISFPLMIGLCTVSDIFVLTLFGEKWVDMIPILKILSIGAMFQSILSSSGVIALSKGETKLILKFGIINTLITIIILLIGLSYGIEGVSFAYLFSVLIVILPNLYMYWNLIELKLIEGLAEIAPVFFISLNMGILVYIIKNILSNFIENNTFILILSILFGIIIYLIGIKIKYKNLTAIIKELRINK